VSKTEEQEILEALLDRLNKQRLPHALELEAKVNAGEILNDYDLAFLSDVMKDMNRAQAVYNHFPEYETLLTKLMSLYAHIIKQGAENEKNPQVK